MADDTREQDTNSSATASAVTAAAAAATGLPKGVVLDKDGKPCRTCTSSKDWQAMMKGFPKKKAAAPAAAAAATTESTAASPAATAAENECPPDVEALGRSTWTLLHTMAATYPERPSAAQQSDMLSFVGLFARLYPCWVCAEDFQAYVRREAPAVGGRGELGLWMCGAHNEVNRKLGKPVFDCSRWEERWRTGWKDGRCD